MDDDKITTIQITKGNLRQLQIVKAIERKGSYNDVIKYLVGKYYDEQLYSEDFFGKE